jgi:thiamine biosynthesis lipoprotein
MKNADLLSRRAFVRRLAGLGLTAGAIGLGGLSPLPALAAKEHRWSVQETRLLMGTIVTITAASADAPRARAAMAAAFAEMDRLIALFDRRKASTALAVLNDQGALAGPPPELTAVLRESARLAARTGNAFNPAVAPLVDLLARGRAAGSLPAFDDQALAEALEQSQPGPVALEGTHIRLGRSDMRLTLDGIAKGYIADAASRVLAAQGAPDHIVNAGGDIRVSGLAADQRPWRIGVQAPGVNGGILAETSLTGGGIATSGNYEQAYTADGSRNHLLSGLTGNSADIASVTVRADSAMRADALATALSLMPPVLALRHVEKYTYASCLIVDRQGRRYATGSWG